MSRYAGFYFAHMVVIRRTENGITSTMEVTVAPDDPIEIRRTHLHNNDDFFHRLRLTSYGEVILAPQAADARHPGFNKMFIESEFVPELSLQIFKRRHRSHEEKSIFMGHMLMVKGTRSLHSMKLTVIDLLVGAKPCNAPQLLTRRST